ncbi:MAG: protein kinase [Deltaproteobacteria bacterium]|nr:protein kinase [Deltaproteobacteria bacterium]
MIIAGEVLGGRFEVRRRLGSGGMGDVFEAFDRDRAEAVAIKTLARADADTFARFKREFRALQSMVHPNLVSIGELICADDVWFFSMELVDGVHFQEFVRNDVGGLRAALRQLVIGVHALHEGGLVHRDIKPSNVMMTRDGRLVILDFGLVTHVDPKRQSYAQGPVGTVEYMAPEQATGRQVGEAADWYSVGVMLYEALTGTMPHHGHALQILVEKQQVEPKAPHEVKPDVPRDLSDLCKELLAIEPAARPTASAIAKKLGIDFGTAARTSTPIVTPMFVGREAELAALAASAEVARTQPRIHAVIGESGIGKSELVARFVRDLATQDPTTLVFSGRCYERETVPYKAFDGIADGLAQELARRSDADVTPLLPPRPTLLVRLFPAFQRIEAIAAAGDRAEEPGEPHEQRRRMFVAFRELIANLARTQRVVLTIDDLQWADADSFLLLRELMRGAPLPLLILATVREGDAALSALAGLPIERTSLGPLSEAECRELAEGIAPQKAANLDLARVSREAGGHPMFLQEIVRHLALSGDSAAADTLDDALAARVALLKPEAQSLLEVVCIAGAPLPIDVAAQACRLDSTVSRSVASLRVAMLVRETQRGRRLTLEPYHDRVRESVANGIAKDRRRELHQRIAYALEAAPEPRDPQLLLRNFLLAELPQRAARYAEDAAQRSEAAHAFDQAAELWRTALDIMPRDADDRRRLQLRLGEALIRAGRGAEAASCYLAAAEGADRATRLECQRHAAEQLVIAGHIAPGLAALESLLAEIGVASPKTSRGSLASLVLNRTRVRLRGLRFRERDRTEIPDADMLVLDVLKAAGTSLSMIDSIRGMDFTTRHLLRALRTGHREYIARALVLESMFYATSSNPARSTRLIDRALEIGADPNDPYIGGLMAGAHGANAYFGGEPVKATEHFARCIEMLRGAPGSNWERSTGRLFRLFSLRFVGDFVELRARYEEYLEDAASRGDVYLESTMRRACVSMFLAEDDVQGAIGELERATWGPPGERYHVQHFHELVAWAEIVLYTGEVEPRAQLDERFARLHSSLLTRVSTIRVVDEFIRARLALAGHRPFTEVARAAKNLAAETTPMPLAWAALLEASLAPSAERFAAAAELSAKAGMRAFEQAARWRVADLRGDAAARSDAEGKLVALGVRDVERTVRLLAPVRRSS